MSTADESKQAQEVPVQEATEAQVAATAKTASLSPGAKLRAARESKGMSMEQVAKETLLTSRYLKALEADDYDTLPGTTFVRGYLRRYAGVVSLSADELVAEFDAIWQARTATAALVANERPQVAHKPAAYGSSASSRRTFFTRSARKLSLATLLSWGSVLLLLALLLGSLFWNDSTPVSPSEETSETFDLNAAITPTPTTVIDLPTSTAASTESLTASNTPATATGAESSAATSPPVAASTPDASAAPVATTPAPAAKPTPTITPVITPTPSSTVPNTASPTTTIPVVSLPAAAPEETTAPVPPRSDTLSFNFTGKSWISVRDSTGQELVYGLKNAGQSVTVTGQPPFAINIGSVRDTQMSRNGTPVNLKPYTRGEIASFRLGR